MAVIWFEHVVFSPSVSAGGIEKNVNVDDSYVFDFTVASVVYSVASGPTWNGWAVPECTAGEVAFVDIGGGSFGGRPRRMVY